MLTCLSDIIWELAPYVVGNANEIAELTMSALDSCRFVPNMDEEESEWTNQLAMAVVDVLDACTEIDNMVGDFLQPYFDDITNFVNALSSWQYLSPELTHATLMMIRDIGTTSSHDVG